MTPYRSPTARTFTSGRRLAQEASRHPISHPVPSAVTDPGVGGEDGHGGREWVDTYDVSQRLSRRIGARGPRRPRTDLPQGPTTVPRLRRRPHLPTQTPDRTGEVTLGPEDWRSPHRVGEVWVPTRPRPSTSAGAGVRHSRAFASTPHLRKLPLVAS